ncbi:MULTISPECIES: PmoA family protein [unclassified Saccharopolyspora]|uniref:DUF6807 domain-containing protein n=1 Tax=unclassified Saccharopolyspora TaxID=2646250 RepID=UPI001CD2BD67|nr:MULTISPECIES: PmoA family protein [unclassified Saccharopolyspora]MCA1190081.1 PmoA family protein [Saccharopolyspora sp. 6T]MCA1191946.1 PmoA family protein [Saccharopolyspora sp. 6V]MCA1224869.1 PmoA family protein [Saccharopolyspora sp. 6M]
MIADLRLGGAVVAEYHGGAELPAHLGPRPHLHPVRTLRGTEVTAVRPADHPWHLGFSLAAQDVDGWNLWGGATYLRGRGYVHRADHGRIEHLGFDAVRPNELRQRLRWCAPDGSPLLDERRRLWSLPAADGWELAVRTELTNPTGRDVRIGSPATNGRSGAGYGGFFWRLPGDGEAFTADAAGEAEVHGSTAPWLAWAGRDHTLVFAAAEPDPWFVRTRDYPGVGAQLAPREPVVLTPGAVLVRGLRVLVADGELDCAAARRWAETDPRERVPGSG